MAITTASQAQLGQATAKNSQVVTTAVKLINSGGGAAAGPNITSIIVTDSGYNNLDDTAAATSNSYIKILGTGFQSTANVFLNGTMVLKANVTFVSSTELRAVLPVSNTGNYAVSVYNSNSAGALYSSSFVISTMPQWLTSATLANVTSNTVFSETLSATSDSSVTYANTTILPTGFNLLANGYYFGNISVGATTTYSFDVKATDAQNQDSTRTFSLTTITVNPYGDFGFSLEGGTLTNIGSGSNAMNNNGASVSTAQAAQGSYSLYFNGSASVDINSTNSSTWSFLSSSPLGTNTLGTIEFYIYPQTAPPRGVMVGSYRSSQEKGWTIDYDQFGNLFFARDSSGPGTYAVGLSFNTWTKLGFVFRTDGNHQIEIYKNGTYHGTYNYGSAATFSEANMRIGRRGDNSLGTVGYIDDFKIWLGTRGPY